MRRGKRLFMAWGVGWAVYMTAMALWSYDGLLSLILQPVAATVVSALTIAAGLLVGLVLLVPPVRRFWNARVDWAIALVLLCLSVMCFGSTVGLTGNYVDPETGRAFLGLHPAAALLSYFLLLFTLAHWPNGKSKRLAPSQILE